MGGWVGWRFGRGDGRVLGGSALVGFLGVYIRMGKNGRELNPMDKLRREEKEREKKRNKNFRVKSREVGHLRHDPRALQEEIRKSKRELYEGGEDDEGRAGLKRKIKRMEDEYNAAVRARKKADPKLMERLGLDPNDTNYNLTGKATEAPASDPLDPENGEESRLFARNRALNRVNPSNLSNPSTVSSSKTFFLPRSSLLEPKKRNTLHTTQQQLSLLPTTTTTSGSKCSSSTDLQHVLSLSIFQELGSANPQAPVLQAAVRPPRKTKERKTIGNGRGNNHVLVFSRVFGGGGMVWLLLLSAFSFDSCSVCAPFSFCPRAMSSSSFCLHLLSTFLFWGGEGGGRRGENLFLCVLVGLCVFFLGERKGVWL